VINGTTGYDVTEFRELHPGGKQILLLTAGRDITDAFKSYHPFTDKPEKVLQKYLIGQVSDLEHVQYKPDSGFYKKMSSRIAEYFHENKLDHKAPWAGTWRMVVVTAVLVLSFLVTNAFWAGLPLVLRVVAAAVFGICQALPLLHVMHDSSHTAFGHNEKLWHFAGRLYLDFVAGGNFSSWLHQHTIGHHIYTNVFQSDPDLPVPVQGDLRRLVDRQENNGYKYQHIYLPFLYGLLGLKVRVQDFTDTFYSTHNGPIRVNHKSLPYVEMYIAKAVWFIWRIVLPLVFFNTSVLAFLGLFLISELATGWHLALNFQVSHISSECEFPNGEEKKTDISEEWAVSQVQTSVDYSHGNWWTTFISGALNYQVTHHLFPTVSQYHYPAIAPIIMEVCKEYNVDYKVLPSFTAAFGAHMKHLKEMGAKGLKVDIHMG
jgi:fatty acid desaturase